jgi:hypothetical protein
MGCFYTPTLRAGFGRTVTFESINEQFDAIEAAWGCLEALIDTVEFNENNTYDNGTVITEYVFDPSLGSVHYLRLQGDVELSIAAPEEGDPVLITLVLADGGSGRFNFKSGATWTTDSNGTVMDSKPWDNEGLGGDYGAIVTCLYDGIGWVYMIFGRNDIDFTATAEPADIFNWR